MGQFFDKWIFVSGMVVLVCCGCKKTDFAAINQNAPDFTRMTFAEVKAVADKGDPRAQEEIGFRFHDGKEVPKDIEAAVEWWQKAARQGFPPAELNLGIAYGRGDGVPKNVQEGIRWVRMAADSNLVQAQTDLGIFYCNGRSGVTQDYTQAFHWFKAAGDQGWPPSQYYLALCLRDGKGTKQDQADAILWLQRAASNGLANAQVALGEHYFKTGLAEDLAELGIPILSKGLPTQIELDTPLTKEQHDNPNFFAGVEWLRKAANQGYPEGQELLALAYVTGLGTGKDPMEAYKWLALASAKQFNLVAEVVKGWQTNKITLTPEQIFDGKLRAEEFSKTNQVLPKSVKEIPGL